jgi:hypothetical protein
MDELLNVFDGLSLAQKAGFASLGMMFLVIGFSMVSLLCGDKRKTPNYVGPKNNKGRAHGTGKYVARYLYISCIDRALTVPFVWMMCVTVHVPLCACGRYDDSRPALRLLGHNGDRYEGEFDDGAFHGFGTYVFQSGCTYRGSWVKGKYEGRGKGARVECARNAVSCVF